MRAGIIQDPYFRDNDIKYRWIALDEWTYETTFSVSKDCLVGSPTVLLVCEGLDTIASIYLNDKFVGYG